MALIRWLVSNIFMMWFDIAQHDLTLCPMISYCKIWGFKLLVDQLCLFVDHCNQFLVKFADQNFPSVRIFVFRETTKFFFTLQAQQFTYILHRKVLNCTLFSCIWVAFWRSMILYFILWNNITCYDLILCPMISYCVIWVYVKSYEKIFHLMVSFLQQHKTQYYFIGHKIKPYCAITNHETQY